MPEQKLSNSPSAKPLRANPRDFNAEPQEGTHLQDIAGDLVSFKGRSRGMHIVKTLVNKQLLQAEADMRAGTPDQVVSDAEEYLVLLDEYLERLRNLKGIPRIEDAQGSPFAQEFVEQIRDAVRTACENATNEKKRIESLLSSFTMVTGWSAVQTLNLLRFKAACDWELIGSQVRSVSRGATMSINDAVLQAKQMRREAYFESPTST